jgi:hypothetical protein
LLLLFFIIANGISSSHISFLKSVGIKTVINMSASNLRQATSLETTGIQVYQPAVKSSASSSSSSSHQSIMANRTTTHISDEIIKESLQLLLDPSHQPLVLTVATTGSSTLEVATLVGCLRRMQHWALSAILYEFRLFTPTSSIYDVNRQFIEKFDITLVTLPKEIPEWLQHEQELWMEEIGHDSEDEEEEEKGKNNEEEDRDRFRYYSTTRVPLTSSKMSANQDMSLKVKPEDD